MGVTKGLDGPVWGRWEGAIFSSLVSGRVPESLGGTRALSVGTCSCPGEKTDQGREGRFTGADLRRRRPCRSSLPRGPRQPGRGAGDGAEPQWTSGACPALGASLDGVQGPRAPPAVPAPRRPDPPGVRPWLGARLALGVGAAGRSGGGGWTRGAPLAVDARGWHRRPERRHLVLPFAQEQSAEPAPTPQVRPQPPGRPRAPPRDRQRKEPGPGAWGAAPPVVLRDPVPQALPTPLAPGLAPLPPRPPRPRPPALLPSLRPPLSPWLAWRPLPRRAAPLPGPPAPPEADCGAVARDGRPPGAGAGGFLLLAGAESDALEPLRGRPAGPVARHVFGLPSLSGARRGGPWLLLVGTVVATSGARDRCGWLPALVPRPLPPPERPETQAPLPAGLDPGGGGGRGLRSGTGSSQVGTDARSVSGGGP